MANGLGFSETEFVRSPPSSYKVCGHYKGFMLYHVISCYTVKPRIASNVVLRPFHNTIFFFILLNLRSLSRKTSRIQTAGVCSAAFDQRCGKAQTLWDTLLPSVSERLRGFLAPPHLWPHAVLHTLAPPAPLDAYCTAYTSSHCGTNDLSFHFFLWGNSLWYTSALDHKHSSATDYAHNPRYYCIMENIAEE